MTSLPSTYERKWPGVLLSPISVANSIVTVSDTKGLHTKAIITLTNGPLTGLFQIKRVLSDTQLYVGSPDEGILSYQNPVAFNGGSLGMEEQERNKFGSEIVFRAVYEEEPAVALRTLLVDPYGAKIDSKLGNDGLRRLAVDAANLIVNVDWPNNFICYNLTQAANSEQVVTIPSTIQRFMIRVRDGLAALQLGFTVGGSSTNYIRLPRGTNFTSGDLDYPAPGPFKLYYQVDKPTVIVEVLMWIRT